MYISEVKDDILNFDFIVPEFFDKNKFRVNVELIPNKLTKEYISEDKKLEYCFKCILGSFNKERKKPIGVFNESTIKIFNRFVQTLQRKIDNYFNKKSEVELTRNSLLDFGNFFDIQKTIDVDSVGNVYPDIFREMEKGSEEKKKTKGGKIDIDKLDSGENKEE